MTMYLLSFDDGAITFPEELPDVAAAVRAVRVEPEDAGVLVFSAGLEHQVPSFGATDATVTDGVPRAVMCPAASGGRTVEPVTEEDF